MAKSFIVSIICFFGCLVVQASPKENTELSYIKIERLFKDGQYSEVIVQGNQLLALINKKTASQSYIYFKTKSLLARTYYIVYSFKDAEKQINSLINEVDTIAELPSRHRSYLPVVQYFIETEEFASASIYLSKIKIDNDTVDLLFNLKKGLVLSQVYIAQGYFGKAQKHIQLNDSAITKAVLPQGDRITQLSFIEALNNIRAQNWVLKLALIKEKGIFKNIDSLVVPKYVFKDNVLENSKFIELKGDICYNRLDYKQAISFYKNALFVLNVSEYHKQRIMLSLKITNLSRMLGDNATRDQFSRHLQMYADRNINKYSGYPMANYLAQIFAEYDQLEYMDAKKQILKLKSKYTKLPDNHFVMKQLLILYKNILLEESMPNNNIEMIDTLSKFSFVHIGNHPAYFNQKIIEQYSIVDNAKLAAQQLDWMRKTYPKYFSLDSTSIISFNYFTSQAHLFAFVSDYANARVASDKALENAYILFGNTSWEYMLSLVDNLKYRMSAGDYSEGVLAKLADLPKLDLLMQKPANKNKYLEYCVKASALANLIGDWDLSKIYIDKAVKNSSTAQHIDFLVKQEVKELQAKANIESGNISLANKLLQQVQNSKKTKFGNNHNALLESTLQLAQLNIITGNYAQTDNFLQKYFEITTVSFGENSLEQCKGLYIKAKHYQAIGDAQRAKEVLENSLKIQTGILGAKNHQLAETQIFLSHLNLALNTETSNNIEKVLIATGKLLDLTIGKNNSMYVSYLEVLSQLYLQNKSYDKALLLLNDAEKYWTLKYGTENVHNADVKMQYGAISYQLGKYSEAEKHLLDAKKMYASIFGETHPSYTLSLAKLGKVYYMLKNMPKCLQTMEDCKQLYLNYVNKSFSTLSFQEKSKFWASMKDEFEFYNFLILSSGDSKLYGNVYNNVLATKGLLMSSEIKLRKQISNSNDTVLVNIFNEWLVQKELFASIAYMSKEQAIAQGLNFAQVQQKLEQLEKKMSERSELFQKTKQTQNASWKNVATSLKNNEVAVEMVRYRFFEKDFKDSVLYAALIVTNKTTDAPELVVLKNGKSMENKFYRYYVNAVMANMNDRHTYKTFWEPIKEKIADSALIYFSSEGIYNQINLEIVKQQNVDKYALDINKFVYLTTTKDIIPLPSSSTKSKNKIRHEAGKIVICGNPQFYQNTTKQKQNILTLLGAENEARDLVALLDSHKITAELLLGNSVTEEKILNYKNPLVLHIATHGFFNEYEGDASGATNPLFNSGLLLAGAGDIFAKTVSSSQKGVLTAFEAMDMDLDHTEMVVLSACETGRGKVQVGEGVMGLQRSFLVAGANCIVLSLFKVNDQITHDLMMKFYEHWIKTGNKRTSFALAKMYIKEKYNSPLGWGAFVMIEGHSDR